MVTLEERELFLKAINNPAWIVDKSEPEVKKSKPKRPKKDYDSSLDLHGLTAEKAIARAKAFLLRCLELQKKRILIIHGKGSGVLRYEIRNFLGNCDYVAEILDAPTRLGGEGAVLVLLRATAARHI